MLQTILKNTKAEIKKEDVYNLTGTILDPANGTVQYKTLALNVTLTDSLISGESITLRIINGNTYSITWPAITWLGVDAPTLTANCQLVIWKENTVLYGMFSGSFV